MEIDLIAIRDMISRMSMFQIFHKLLSFLWLIVLFMCDDRYLVLSGLFLLVLLFWLDITFFRSEKKYKDLYEDVREASLGSDDVEYKVFWFKDKNYWQIIFYHLTIFYIAGFKLISLYNVY